MAGEHQSNQQPPLGNVRLLCFLLACAMGGIAWAGMIYWIVIFAVYPGTPDSPMWFELNLLFSAWLYSCLSLLALPLALFALISDRRPRRLWIAVAVNIPPYLVAIGGLVITYFSTRMP
jgi:hypothetical protein